MKGFKKYFHEDEDVSKTIAKLPHSHQQLAKQFKVLFEPQNTLQGDDDHVVMVTNKPRPLIKIAAPMYHSREHTLLHEIAHLVYETFVKGTPLEKEWAVIAQNTPMKKQDRDNAEEYFAHAYGTFYSKNRLTKFDIPEWMEFIKRLPS